MPITTLINTPDSFELVRDQIAAILVTETAAQMALATAASQDPELWKLRVFKERTNPWEQFLNNASDPSPVVNVWYEGSSFSKGKSNISERHLAEGTFNIDCYGTGVATDTPGGGHTPGDLAAAATTHRALRLVRNILMASEYTYLGMQGLVWHRWPGSVTTFRPDAKDTDVVQILGSRLVLNVDFNEFSPQYEPETLDYLSATVVSADDGELVLAADYDYTL